MNDENIKKLCEIFFNNFKFDSYSKEDLDKYVRNGIYDINNSVGVEINYLDDLKAQALLENYVLYAIYKRLYEFKQLYIGDYVELQIKYNRDS